MDCRLGGSSIHYRAWGTGVPLVVLHGAGVDHRELVAALEPVVPHDGYRRIHPDLPGMGRSSADPSIASNDDVVDLLGEFLDQVADGPVLLLGHSYGAYLARGLAARRPDRVRGLALLCPVGERTGDLPEPTVVRTEPPAYAELEPDQREGFDDYFVVRTAALARRYRDHVVPGTALAEAATLERIFAGWSIEVGTARPTVPVLIAAGRRDTSAGYADAVALLDAYPNATLAVLDDAGHALPHEQPRLLRALLVDWLARTEQGSGAPTDEPGA